MKYSIDPDGRLVRIHAQIAGPRISTKLGLALDTGSSQSLISASVLHDIGYEISASEKQVPIMTFNGAVNAPIIRVARLATLGHERLDFPVLCYDLQPAATVDGLLGLDFMRNQKLTIDFRAGCIELA